jgi:hypothetical protein
MRGRHAIVEDSRMKKTSLALASLAGLCLAGTASAASASHAKAQAATHHPSAAASSTPAEGVWNWALIDTNKDNLIEPAEMEKFLADNPGPLKKKG